MIRSILRAGSLRECLRHLLVIEGRAALGFLGINEGKFLCAARQIIAIPEPGVVCEPVRTDLGLVDTRSLLRSGLALIDGLQFLHGRDVLLPLLPLGSRTV